MSAGAGVPDPGDSPNLMNKFFNVLLRTFSKNIYEDMVNAVGIVRESNVDWTIVRVPMLTDGPKTGKVQVAWVGKEWACESRGLIWLFSCSTKWKITPIFIKHQ
jgi:hypothetical protein